MNKKFIENIQSVIRKNLTDQSSLRKFLIIIAGLLLIVVLINKGWMAYANYIKDLNNRIELKNMQYKNLARVVDNSKQYEELNNSLQQYKNEIVGKKFITAETLALSEVNFQNVVNDLAKKSKVNILSMRMLPRSQLNGLYKLKIGINCRAEIGAISDFLKQVHDSSKFISFDQLEIKIVNRRERRFYNFNAQLSAWTEKQG